MFNEAPNFKKEGKPLFPKCDVCIQLHHEAIWKNPKNRSDPGHYDWLKSGNTPEIYMQENYPEIPKSVRYPIEEVMTLTGNAEVVIKGKRKKLTYFASSPDLAFALVAHMWKKGRRFKQVEVHGIELETASEYQFQRTGFGFWIGYLTALGIKIILHNSILSAPMYGYEGDVIIPSERFQKRITELQSSLGDEINIYQQEAKDFLENLSGLLTHDISKLIEQQLNDLIKRNEPGAVLNGRIKENQRSLERALAMEGEAGVAVFSVGDFDNPRASFNKQLLQVQTHAVQINAHINLSLKRLINLKRRSKNRQKMLNEFGALVTELMNKNMLSAQIAGAIKETEYYIDLIKQSYGTFRRNN
jgi:hypothetical protein